MIKIFLICSLLFSCYHPESELNAESEAHNMTQQETPTSSLFIPAFSLALSYPKLAPPLKHPHLRKQGSVSRTKDLHLSVLQEPQNIYLLYISTVYNIFLLSLSDFTGCTLQWKLSRVLRSTPGVIPTAVLRSELSLPQQTGGAEAKRLFLPREQGSRGEKRWMGANGTSLSPFKLQEKMDFYNPLL